MEQYHTMMIQNSFTGKVHALEDELLDEHSSQRLNCITMETGTRRMDKRACDTQPEYDLHHPSVSGPASSSSLGLRDLSALLVRPGRHSPSSACPRACPWHVCRTKVKDQRSTKLSLPVCLQAMLTSFKVY